ncbi:MAG: M20/M25/M40 family metallo-hydrolase [Gammaproteobacteria bacterium]
MKPAELVERLVATPSVSGDESRIAAFVASYAESFGVGVQRAANNVWFTLGAATGPTLLFISHLDTVPPCAGWRSDPLRPRWDGRRLYGLGANDAKASVAAMLSLAASLARDASRIPGRIVFALTAEEETGGPGGVASVLREFGPIDAAVVGEPTGLDACAAQRGMLLLKCTAKGRSAHVAHAQLADNAIERAARDITRLTDKTFDPHPLLGATRAQVTQVSGGLQRNQVPDRCEFFVDLRTTPNLDHANVAAQLAAVLESEVAIHSERYAPKATALGHAIVRAALAANGRAAPVGSGTTSDWAFLGEIPAVKMGPGDSRRSHCPDEYIECDEVVAGAAVYGEIARHYFREANA